MANRNPTYEIAKSAGDQDFLFWVYERMKFVHKEDECIDYMNTLRDFATRLNEKFEPRADQAKFCKHCGGKL